MKCVALAAAEVQCTVSGGPSCLCTVICIWLLATWSHRRHVCVLYGNGQITGILLDGKTEIFCVVMLLLSIKSLGSDN